MGSDSNIIDASHLEADPVPEMTISSDPSEIPFEEDCGPFRNIFQFREAYRQKYNMLIRLGYDQRNAGMLALEAAKESSATWPEEE